MERVIPFEQSHMKVSKRVIILVESESMGILERLGYKNVSTTQVQWSKWVNNPQKNICQIKSSQKYKQQAKNCGYAWEAIDICQFVIQIF